MQYDPTHKVLALLERVTQGPNAGGIGTGHRADGLDFQGHQLPSLFEDEVHFVAGAVPPGIEFALERVQRAPALQGLEEGLFQPEAGIRCNKSFHDMKCNGNRTARSPIPV